MSAHLTKKVTMYLLFFSMLDSFCYKDYIQFTVGTCMDVNYGIIIVDVNEMYVHGGK